MNRLALSLHDQTLELLFPEGLRHELTIMLGAAAIDVAAANHRISVFEDRDGSFTLRIDNEPANTGLGRADLLGLLQDEVVRMLVVDAASAVILHAGAVAWGNRSVLLAGQSGAGKSSLAAWFAANGFRYLTDEVVALTDGGSGLVGFPRAIVLKGEAADAVLGISGFQPAAVIESDVGKVVRLPPQGSGPDSRQACGLIVFPRFEAGASLHIAAIGAAQAGLRLMQCNLNARNLPDEGFGEIVALARAVPAIALRYGDFDQLGGVVDVLARLFLDPERRPADSRRFLSAFNEPDVPRRTTVPAAPVFEIPAPTASRPPRRLTIGMATYDDYDGVYFSLQALRLFHPEIVADTNFLVIDNRPDGPCSAALKQLEGHMPNFRYVPFAERTGTSVKNLVFEESESEFVLCMDCHVLVAPGAIRRLLDYFAANPDTPDLLQGPLVYDDLTSMATHFNPVWRTGMYGQWDSDPRAADADGAAFDIPMQGMGLFACRRAAWAGFNGLFRGFGAEEGYIHEKFRRGGARTLCLPFLRWVHRFNRPLGVPYPNRWEDRIRNYMIGFREVGWPTDGVVDHFREHLGREAADRIFEAIELELAER